MAEEPATITPMTLTEEHIALDETAFPIFSSADLRAVSEAGEIFHFEADDYLIEAGTRNYDCYFIIEGEVRVVDVSGDEEREVLIHQPGHFIGDLDLLTGRPGVVDIIAITQVKAACIRSADIRSFLVKHPTVGDRMVAAFIKRRELLSETDFEGIRVYGHKDCHMTLQIQEFFYRNGVPHTWKNIEDQVERDRLDSLGIDCSALPLLTYGQKELFRSPTLAELAKHIGIQRETTKTRYDTVIIGCGPSGLGAAVYASSEGLSTLVLDNIGPGGQAGSSSKIENYAGFPTGISGRELALRSYLQALKFGAELLAPCSVHSIRPLKNTEGYSLGLCTGEEICAKTIIISTGISYHKLKVPGMDELNGSGLYYNATQVEAILCKEKPVHIIGAGNSAGQAAMFLSTHATEVNLLVRGDSLEKSMSQYLWSRVQQNPKIKLRFRSEMTQIEGTNTIEAIHVEGPSGSQREETAGVFIFIGGSPCTDFLPPEIALDEKGFVLAGAEVAQHASWKEDRLPCALETSCPGIFVSGDCRAGTTKRVAFAIGDGALAVTCVHDHLGTYA